MSVDERFAAIRKGLLEFLILKIVAADKVYVADILKRLSATDFATQEGTLYPLLSKMRRDGLLDYEWQESDAGSAAQVLRAHGQREVAARRAERLLETSQRDHHAAWKIAMQKVISINLNGNAYQLDESGYDSAARVPRARGADSSSDNPDRAEIMADLEQAIADKCQQLSRSAQDRRDGKRGRIRSSRRWGPSTARPVTATIRPAATERLRTSARRNAQDTPPRRLYRIPDGAMIAGVCNGLAAYFHVDVTFVRIAFVVGGAPHQGRRHHRLRRDDVRHPGGEHAGGTRGGRRRAAQREGRDRPREKAVCGRAASNGGAIGGGNAASGGGTGWPAGATDAYAPPPWAALLLPCLRARARRAVPAAWRP